MKPRKIITGGNILEQQKLKKQTMGKKFLFIFLSVNLVGVAVALMLESQLGCDPIGLLCDGIAHMLSVSFGIGSFVYNLTIIVIALLVARKNLGAGTIVYGLLSGFFIDFYRSLISGFALGERGILIASIAFIIGEVLMAAAFALLMELEIGMTALDAFLVKIQEKTKIPYAFLKMGMDICFVVSGGLMGGSFGIGTIISAMVTGVLVAQWVKVIISMQNKVQNKYVVGGYENCEEA